VEKFTGKYELKGGDGDVDDIATIGVATGDLSIKHEQYVVNLFPVSGVEFVPEDQSFDVVLSKAQDR